MRPSYTTCSLMIVAILLEACMDDESTDVLTNVIDTPLQTTTSRQIATWKREQPVVTSQLTGATYTTPLGFSGNDVGMAIAVDSLGNAYITGTSVACGGTFSAFVAKMSPSGTNLYYSCLGQTQGGDADIAVDGSGNAYVVIGGGLTKLDATGSVVIYSISIGTWVLTGIAIDSLGNAYVTGYAGPTVSQQDVVVAKINPGGTALIYAVSLGGSQTDVGASIAVDSARNAYITGYTNSANFPVFNATQPTMRGDQDAFVAKINASGSQLMYSTYLGGDAVESASGIAVDSSGNAYVCGTIFPIISGVRNFPVTAGAAQASPPAAFNAYVAKLSATGALAYATYLGGSGYDVATGIAVNPSTGVAYVAGYTQSTDFPVSGFPFQSTLSGSSGNNDAFVTQVNQTGSFFTYSSYLGGTAHDEATGIALDTAGNAYVVGATMSSDFPTNVYAPAGGWDAFVAKFNGP